MLRTASKRHLAGLALAALALCAPAAPGARLVAVRLGQHAGFARVVFESDARVAFDIEKPQAGDAELRVHLDAGCAARSVAAPGLAVGLEPLADGACLARVHAPGPVRIEAQVFASPPRVVLDLMPAAPIAAEPAPPVAAEPAPSVAAEPAPSVEPAPAPEPPQEVPSAEPSAPAVAAPPPALAPEPAKPATPATAATEPPAWDLRSLAVGLVLGGFAGILVAGGFQRRRAALPAPVLAPAPVAPVEIPPADPGALGDLVAMLQRIDRRLAGLEARLEATREGADRVAAREAAQGEELASQRVALARLDRALRVPPAPPVHG